MFLDSIINTVNNVAGAVAGQASELAPLAGTMSAALKNIGIQPPTELSALSTAFHNYIVAPNTQVTGASPVNDIINYVGTIFKQQQSGQQLSSTQQIVANGAGSVIGGIKMGPMFFIIAGAIVLIIVLIARK
jgi:hypothetical protein